MPRHAPASLVLCAALWAAFAEAAAEERHSSLFGGIHTRDSWQDHFLDPAGLETYDQGLLGIALALEWPTRFRRLGVGLEGQIVLHLGDGQSYAQVNLPVVVRYTPNRAGPFRSFAYGLGPSYASDIPEVEIDKGGSSQRALFYWLIEAEFGTIATGLTPFLRLHHRSNGFEAFDSEGSSNAVVIGVRRRF